VLFDEYKERCGFGDNTLAYAPDVQEIGDAEWSHVLLSMQQQHKHEDPQLRAIPPVKVGAFDMFKGHETIWVSTFMLVLFAIIVFRAWPGLSLTQFVF
jgi:hypothetical protein